MGSAGKTIVVIGAGVTGLQTSISLLQAGYRVFIIAKHLPGDESIEYTSPWAGGHWRSHAPASDPEQQQWDVETYKHWLEVIKKEEQNPSQSSRSGLALRKSTFYSTSPQDPWFSKTVLNYEQIPTASLINGYNQGHTYTSVMVNVPMYLNYLLETAKSLGAIVIRATLPHRETPNSTFFDTLHAADDIVRLHSAQSGNAEEPSFAAFVNATGISALNIVPDPNIYPVRGQTVTVKGEAHGITTIDAPSSDPASTRTSIMYVLPRPHSNTTILGGTKQVGDWTAEPDPKTTEEILRRAKEWAPELLNEKGEFDVLNEQVGLRPGRKGGARVEIEELDGFLVCHAYGHAGAGYQNSIGSANKVVGLLKKHFGES
ncbi:nucleotide-binding domain-containing protein [Stipitochalara longipes BDJ]|nr:nucleotide-binding domain-containing protein [Stipitochalara longipes BDJ]